MGLEFIVQDKFSGGINATTDPNQIAADELVEAQDVLVDAQGLARRRGPFIKQTTAAFLHKSDDVVVATNRHAYHSDSQGLFVLSSNKTNAQNSRLWFVPYSSAGWGSPILLIDTTGTSIGDVPVRSGAITTAITKVQPVTNNDENGSTSEFDADEEDLVLETKAGRNAKYNRTLITCDAFTVAVAVRKGRQVGGESTTHTKNLVRWSRPGDWTAPTGPGSWDYNTVNADKWYFRLTALYTEDNDGINLTKRQGVLGTANGISIPLGEDQSVEAEPWFEDRSFSTAVLVNGYAFLAGENTMPQHFFWSNYENSLKFEEKDFEHLPDETSSHVVGLSSLDANLVVFKERAIFTVRVSPDPTDWVASQRASIGTIDQRTIAKWRSQLIFANARGIYSFDGYDVKPLSTKIDALWRPVLASWQSTWSVCSSVYADYYSIYVLDGTGALQLALNLHIPSGAWTSMTNTRFTACALTPDNKSSVGFYYPIGSPARSSLCEIGSMFNGCVGNDNISFGPQLSITTARIANDNRFRNKVWRRIEVSQGSYGAADSGSLGVYYSTGTDPAETSDLAYPSTFQFAGGVLPAIKVGATNDNLLPKRGGNQATPPASQITVGDTTSRVRIGVRSRAIAVRIRELPSNTLGMLSSARITGIRIGFKPMRQSRDEGN